jgi:hypothetical protein
MKYDLGEVQRGPTPLIKTAFLSYYISMYNTVNSNIGIHDGAVTVDEIFDFIQDLKREYGKFVPEISREDICFCFRVLQVTGVCKA